ncbi:SRPBCC family protein [Micromonospora sp. WMMD1102]|uniref:SRPBCC family protein n=1 Tax=Micromonospora sp. WMMD1102 TaxID=3016105 RepID=UPI002415243A|nr:SRPBCC family protein [Micromonospora sp. WMMD1102]MDG4787725.1 SRPBCC family protein [Micromonospora sp. WMMD1102]
MIRSRIRRPLALAAAVATGFTLVGAVGSPAAAASPRGVTCQGRGVDPDAEIRYRAETVIGAPLHTVWRLQTDVERWPSWHAPVLTNDRLDHGPLRKGSQFRWTTPVIETPISPATTLTVTSTVQQIQNQKCIRWRGPASGDGLRIDEGVHVWTFSKVAGGIRVQTEETWTGDQVESDVALATAALAGGLEMWLRDLKATAEAGAEPCHRAGHDG